ncbi:MAG: DUF2723 domain-containing protein, partial [Bdellovibrionota bacterium]
MSRKTKSRDARVHRGKSVGSDRLLPWISGFTAFPVYFLTLCPDVGGGDSGELTAVAATLGTAHPPGYPIYTLLGHLFWLAVPLSNAAARLNLFSALTMAVAVGLLCRVLLAFTRLRPAALAGAWLFALAPLVWTYAVVAEVFALHLLLITLWLNLVFSWSELGPGQFLGQARFRLLLGFALVFGLAAAHHHTLALFAAPTVVWILWESWRSRQTANLMARAPLLLAVFFAAALLP